MDFDTAFGRLIGFEGGVSNNPQDPGGLTKYGISQKAFPNVDIANLTLEQAKAIYKAQYWDAIRADTLPDVLRYVAFDAAVNSGVNRSNVWLQLALSGNPEPYQALARFVGYRLKFMASLSTWSTFGRGWTLRNADILTK
jgi:lysozyme family protein